MSLMCFVAQMKKPSLMELEFAMLLFLIGGSVINGLYLGLFTLLR